MATGARLPRPARRRRRRPLPPPWNPSSQIDDDGFLRLQYGLLPGEWEEEASIGGRHGHGARAHRGLPGIPVTVRQVPGDGNCLFHSVATCLSYAVNGTHVSMRDTGPLREASRMLRAAAVDCLSSSSRRRLFLQGGEYLRAGELVEAAAAQYELTGEEYCEQMRRDSYWGGGPEIVALCNVLRRPIHVYELCSDVPPGAEEGGGGGGGGGGGNRDASATGQGGKEASAPPPPPRSPFRLRRMACFGSPRFDRREPLHILSADSRFPDVQAGRQLDTGNHFLALFPDPRGEVRAALRRTEGEGGKRRRRKGRPRPRVRGGGPEGGRGGRRKERSVRRWGRGGEDRDGGGDGDGDVPSLWEMAADRLGRVMDWQ